LALGGLMLLTGCGASPDVSVGPNGDLIRDITNKVDGQTQKAVDTTASGWPEGMPADVPPFTGKVRNVMVGGGSAQNSRARLFLQNVSLEQFNQYLASLKQAGYKLQGVVYTHDSTAASEEAARKRAADGNYDAVKADKGSRKLTLSYPGPSGDMTLDVDGLSAVESQQVNRVSWPKNWAERVPPPDTCQLDQRSISANDSKGLSLYCTFSDSEQSQLTQIYEAYQQKLRAKGFTNSQPGSSFSITFTRADLTVRLGMIANRLVVEAQVK